MNNLKFVEKEIPSNSRAYKIIQIYQSTEWCKDPNNNAKRDDYFDHEEY